MCNREFCTPKRVNVHIIGSIRLKREGCCASERDGLLWWPRLASFHSIPEHPLKRSSAIDDDDDDDGDGCGKWKSRATERHIMAKKRGQALTSAPFPKNTPFPQQIIAAPITWTCPKKTRWSGTMQYNTKASNAAEYNTQQFDTENVQ